MRFDCSDDMQREAGRAAASAAVRRGELVVFPTDTLYGIGCDAFSPMAVSRLLAAKQRGRDLPVPVLVGTWRTVNGLVDSLPQAASDLIAAFWPGGLTLVLAQGGGLSWDLGDAKGTFAVRMPLHPVALELLSETGPLATSSANISGRPPAITAGDAEEQLGESVAVYLDGGQLEAAVPSTIVDLTGPVPIVLREGVVTREQLEDVLGAGSLG